MTETEKVSTVKTILGECDEDLENVIPVYLRMAESAIQSRLYPFDSDLSYIPSRYDMTQCELAVRYINRRGAEGESAHNENSINRTYGSVDDSDILNRIVPFARVSK